jgi:hypothetical protein
MNERQRHNHGDNQGNTDDRTPMGGGGQAQRRQQAAAFYAAADDAINKAISGDSAKFNQAARQEGGE